MDKTRFLGNSGLQRTSERPPRARRPRGELGCDPTAFRLFPPRCATQPKASAWRRSGDRDMLAAMSAWPLPPASREPGRRRGLYLAALLTVPLVALAQSGGWKANPEVVARASRQQPGFNYEESRVPAYVLPDPLATTRGRVTTSEKWRARRAEILDLFRDNVYGRSPGRPEQSSFAVIEESPRAMDGR